VRDGVGRQHERRARGFHEGIHGERASTPDAGPHHVALGLAIHDHRAQIIAQNVVGRFPRAAKGTETTKTDAKVTH